MRMKNLSGVIANVGKNEWQAVQFVAPEKKPVSEMR
jgi:hypothetical protein